MTSEVKVFAGKTKKDALADLNSNFKFYQIIDEKAEKWLFWIKSYEIKALVQLEEPAPTVAPVVEEAKVAEKTKRKNKDNEKKPKDEKKEELLKMLSEPTGLTEIKKRAEFQEVNASNNIEDLKVMVETLIQKIEEEGGRRPLPLPLEKMESFLREQEVDSRTARIYVEKVEEKFKESAVIEEEDVNENIRKMIENQINVFGAMDTDKTKIIALVGPTGVGKTTTLAKLGWEIHKSGKTVGFITTDTFRSGAKEQLDDYAKEMDAETVVAKGAQELKEAIQYFQNVNKVDHILIDTVGRNPMLENSVDSVNEYLAISNPDLTCLVLSSTSKVKDMKEILSRFEQAEIHAMIFTKLDETLHIGSLLNVFNFTKLPLMYVTDGQDITKNIYAPSKRMLAEKILDKEVKLEGRLLA